MCEEGEFLDEFVMDDDMIYILLVFVIKVWLYV